MKEQKFKTVHVKDHMREWFLKLVGGRSDWGRGI